MDFIPGAMVNVRCLSRWRRVVLTFEGGKTEMIVREEIRSLDGCAGLLFAIFACEQWYFGKNQLRNRILGAENGASPRPQ